MRSTSVTALIALLLTTNAGCKSNETPPSPRSVDPAPKPVGTASTSRPIPAVRDRFARARAEMVVRQIVERGVTEPAVVAAMRSVPRHEFVPASRRSQSYNDRPLAIGHGQTISQPYIVAAMTELAAVKSGDKVLEIGTGSGYQAAVLAQMGAVVYSIEIIEPLGKRAAQDLARLGYKVHTRIGDGYVGWPEAAPFDAVLLTAAPPKIPQPLLDQLAVGGRLVAPVGELDQTLKVVTRTAEGHESKDIFGVRFVPMTGRAQFKR